MSRRGRIVMESLHIRAGKKAALLLMAGLALAGCGNTKPDDASTLRVALTGDPAADVVSVRMDVSTEGTVVASRNVRVNRLGTDAVADGFFTLSAGPYHVK